MLPAGFVESYDLILKIDQCLLSGFTDLEYAQQETLLTLGRVFSETPLNNKLQIYLNDLAGGIFQPEAFVFFAAARAALQGAQYNTLSQHVKTMLGRSAEPQEFAAPCPVEQVPPLLDSVRHWLMNIAITGFSHLTPPVITAFRSILEQIQANPDTIRTSALLTGFVNELMSHPAEIPLFRWGDLWTRAMLTPLIAEPPSPTQKISGTLFPLGLSWRQHSQLISVVVYGILETGSTTEFVRITQSAYKVDAVRGDQGWLLFPDIAPLLESLSAGKSLALVDISYVTGGHLLWNPAAASPGTPYKLMEVALSYFAPQAARPVQHWELPPEQRHPVHLAEPVTLADFHIRDGVIEANGYAFKLDERTLAGTELGGSGLEEADRLFGLIRFDAGEWLFQPLAASQGKTKPVFIGKESSKILKKPPKGSTVNILKERASRLLREKS